MLEKMTESLFAETLKRIAENVWQKKFTEIMPTFKNYYGTTDERSVTAFMTTILLECLKRDKELRTKLEAAITSAAHLYFEGKL